MPEFIKLARLGNYRKPLKNPAEELYALCLRKGIPQETLCAMGCKNTIGDPINIGVLERFVADWELETGARVPEIAPSTGKSVAVAGGRPAGLSVAREVAERGTPCSRV